MKSIELSRALAAAMSLRLPGTVGKIANKMRYIDEKAPLFVKGGIIRNVEPRRFERIYSVGVSSRSRSIPALGGVLYGAAALRHDVVLTGSEVTEGHQDSRVDINDMNFEEDDNSSWSFTTATSYSIVLEANSGGWNLISLPTVPSSTAIATVLGDASSAINAVWVYDPENIYADDSGWLVYYPTDSELSILETMTTGYGYWVSVNSDATISGSGSLLSAQQVPPSRTLISGWNLIGYYQIPGEASSNMTNAFSSIGSAGTDYTSLWGFDNASGTFTNVSVINPGNAFWISVPVSGKVYTPSNLGSET